MSKFTRKHYKAIAEVISQEKLNIVGRPNSEHIAKGIYLVQGSLERLFKSDNPSFKSSLFVDACEKVWNL